MKCAYTYVDIHIHIYFTISVSFNVVWLFTNIDSVWNFFK